MELNFDFSCFYFIKQERGLILINRIKSYYTYIWILMAFFSVLHKSESRLSPFFLFIRETTMSISSLSHNSLLSVLLNFTFDLFFFFSSFVLVYCWMCSTRLLFFFFLLGKLKNNEIYGDLGILQLAIAIWNQYYC